jgi:hypothetical protein
MHTKFWLESLKERDHQKPRHRREDNIKMALRETRLEGVD